MFVRAFFFLLFSLSYCNCIACLERMSGELCNNGMSEKDSIMSVRREPRKKGKNAMDRMLRSFNRKDTTYIIPCYYDYSVMLQGSGSIQDFQFSGKDEGGHRQKLSFAAKPSWKVGPYIAWRWLVVGYSFDVGRPLHTASASKEFNLSLYSSKVGVDFIYQKNKENFKLDGIHGFGAEDGNKALQNRNFRGLRSSIMSVNMYYIFNNRRFSYPAAFSQTTVQKKSQGSWKMGFQYTHQKTSFDYTKLPHALLSGEDGVPLIENLKFNKVDFYDYSFCAGYAYNWVFSKNCLLSLSAMPAIGYKHTKGEQSENKLSYYMNNINFDLVGRLGLVWNNSHFFGGSSFVVHTYDYRKEKFSMINVLGYFNVYLGMYFGRKK